MLLLSCSLSLWWCNKFAQTGAEEINTSISVSVLHMFVEFGCLLPNIWYLFKIKTNETLFDHLTLMIRTRSSPNVKQVSGIKKEEETIRMRRIWLGNRTNKYCGCFVRVYVLLVSTTCNHFGCCVGLLLHLWFQIQYCLCLALQILVTFISFHAIDFLSAEEN